MKKFFFSMLLLLTAHTIFAQQKPFVIDPVKDRKENDGYTIQLKTAPGNTVLFNLIHAGKPVFNQPLNPLTLQPQGFFSKEDAFNVAQWMIEQYGKEGRFPMSLPAHAAIQLHVKNQL